MKEQNKIKEIFGSEKPIIGMLHLKGSSDEEVMENARYEMKLLLENKVDAVLVENYFGSPAQVEMLLKYLKENYGKIHYGVNLLHNDELAFELAEKYDAKFIQLDSVAGHLEIGEDIKFHEFITKARKKCKAFILGGVRFKYQPYKSGRPMEEDLKIGMSRCDAIVVTGDATGQETDLDKIKTFRRMIGNYPLFVGAGMTPENAAIQMEYVDGAIVGSYFKDNYKDVGNICKEHIVEFMSVMEQIRKADQKNKDEISIQDIQQYITFKEELFCGIKEQVPDFLRKLELEGTEVFMDDVVPRGKLLFTDEAEKEKLKAELRRKGVKRLHGSYWAYPTSFLTKNHFRELVERMGGEDAITNYYGDLTGNHMFKRWIQEYQLADELKAQSYTFHLIDYAPIDGRWEYTIKRSDICQAMIYMIQNFLNILMEKRMLTDTSPIIEVENAGWGLEYGIQSAKDFEEVFHQLYDPYQKVRIGWDINHLLHAIGFDKKNQEADFFLTDEEISDDMRNMRLRFKENPEIFTEKWLEENLLDKEIRGKIGSLHISDCAMKSIAYFKNGRLIGHYYDELQRLSTWEEMEEYGVHIVLSEYDSHVVLGEGILNGSWMSQLIKRVKAENPDLVLLHELKNSYDQEEALIHQLKALQDER